MTNSIFQALKIIKDAYYASRGQELTDFVLNAQCYEALQQELYRALALEELPNNIVLYGMTIRKES